MSGPRCGSLIVPNDGTIQLGGQRFRCSQCGRRFTRRSNSAFSGRGFPDDIIALAVRWYVRYRLSYAEVSEWLAERGVLVDQSTIYRWVQRFLPLFGEAARKHRDPVGPDWRVDETYARIRGSTLTSKRSDRGFKVKRPLGGSCRSATPHRCKRTHRTANTNIPPKRHFPPKKGGTEGATLQVAPNQPA